MSRCANPWAASYRTIGCQWSSIHSSSYAAHPYSFLEVQMLHTLHADTSNRLPCHVERYPIRLALARSQPCLLKPLDKRRLAGMRLPERVNTQPEVTVLRAGGEIP